ncbi:unnamed protein product [Effrenium voratum]|uniref:Cytosine-specific methyltransferase n=1 Tax=Effrenium voratum TaxID=2562239 RepID=A0AA36I097_9DINO|nr:unnamed protein product [Effrenium voratum]
MVIETCEHKHSGITVASACRGWCSELIALTRLGVRHTCCFACDICRKAKALSTRTYQHHKWFDNVMDESFLRAPTVDFFFSGFPCQSFSTAGLGKGIADLRGIVVFYVLHYIYRAKPKCFLLENVEGLLTNHKPILVLILEVIMEMKDAAGQRLYNVSWKALDTSQYSGLPHHRVRVFIAGVLAKSQKSDMKWPDPIPMRPLNDFLEKKQPEVALNSLAPGYYNHVKTALTRIINQGDDPFKNQYVVDISCSQKRQAHFMKGVSPCLTKNRAASKGHWLTKESRWMTLWVCHSRIFRTGSFQLLPWAE